jgi:cellulose/xylan binding protein with CBM9 domain
MIILDITDTLKNARCAIWSLKKIMLLTIVMWVGGSEFCAFAAPIDNTPDKQIKNYNGNPTNIPILNGELTEKSLRDVKPLDFQLIPLTKHSYNRKKFSKNKTLVRVAVNKTHIAFYFTCEQENAGSIKNRYKTQDSMVFLDDSVEVFIDPLNNAESLYHIAVNTDEIIFDAQGWPALNADASWKSQAEVKVTKTSTGYTTFIKIPLLSLGIETYTPGELWGINFRRRIVSGEPEVSMLMPSVIGFRFLQNYSVEKNISIADPAVFPDFSIGQTTGNIKVIVSEKGSLNSRTEQNVLKARIENNSEGEIKLISSVTSLDDSQKIISEKSITTTIPPKGRTSINLRYQLPPKTKFVNFSIKDEKGKEYYTGKLHRLKPMPARTPEVKGKFDELLVEKTSPLKGARGYLWAQNALEPKYFYACKFLGRKYSSKAILKDIRDHHLIPIFSLKRKKISYNSLEKHAALLRELKMKVAFSVNYKMPIETDDFPLIGYNKVFLPDPNAQKEYFAQIKKAIEKYPDLIEAVFIGDEDHTLISRALKIMVKMPEYKEYLQKYDDFIKKHYGFGKWGLFTPAKTMGEKRHKYAAITRWLNEFMIEHQKKTVKLLREIAPDVKIYGSDSFGGYSHHYSRWKGQDVISRQEQPNNEYRHNAVVKFLSDVSDTPNIWPCFHFSKASREELRNYLSSGFQVGQNGSLLFDITSALRLPANDQLFSPYRWRYQLEALDFFAKGYKAKTPESNTGIFFSNDASQNYPGHFGSYNTRHVFYPFALLGPKAGGWFTFFEDDQLLKNKDIIDKFSIIFIPLAKMVRPEIPELFYQSLSKGKTLVFTDPESFSINLKGEDLDVRKKFLGNIKMTNKIREKQVKLVIDGKTVLAPTFNMAGEYRYSFTGVKDENVILRYENDQPAAIQLDVNGGKVIWFGFTVFNWRSINDKNWELWFKQWLPSIGMKLKHKIWNLKLPDFPGSKPQYPEDFCLTNNHLFWEQFRPRQFANLNSFGSYKYIQNSPDRIADSATLETWIDFKDGKLTDRVIALSDFSKKYYHTDKVNVAWNKLEKTEILFKFPKKFKLSSFKAYTADSLPSFTVYAGDESLTNWQLLGSQEGKGLTPDIEEVIINFKNPIETQIVKVVIEGNNLPVCLIECELWGRQIE